MASPLDLYESLDVIGNGSFGIIRKVRRKTDGVVLARKELNFDRMTERDRKQIVAEVNILKDLHHEHIVRYHDRHVDRDAGILYILMEYCGGGDLSSVIKQAQRHNRLIPEDTIWNYFMQILLALNYCHHPNGSHGRTSSIGTADGDGKEKRPQILHRDLKPDNVFLDESNNVKLGDFGLSKALAQASFANTYVGTPYYMSPELMQEKAYDSKSDIWSLGCLIYELCALKPPFHEAKTHAELSILIRNGRVPPLPKGYSPALTTIIKSMLNLNPALRPSATQLLQHEKIDLALKVFETQKMLNTVKAHKSALLSKERDLIARETALVDREAKMVALVAQKDEELTSLRSVIAEADSTLQQRVREAIARRDEELRAMVIKKEAEVAARMAHREQEIMEAVSRREEDMTRMWAEWERQTREAMGRAVDERMEWVQQQANELEQERERLEIVKAELEAKMKALEAPAGERRIRSKNPLEEVKNIMAPLSRLADSPEPIKTASRPPAKLPVFQTPLPTKSVNLLNDMAPPSAMKGVILTTTGEPVATPTPAELAKLFVDTPKVGLNFAKIFDFDGEDESGDSDGELSEDGYETDTRPRTLLRREKDRQSPDGETTPTQATSNSRASTDAAPVRPTRLRRPSIRASSASAAYRSATVATQSTASSSSGSSRTRMTRAASTSAVSSSSSAAPAGSTTITLAALAQAPQPQYDLNDVENLPSPFIKKVEDRATTTVKPTAKAPRKSGSTLRAMAVVNAAKANARPSSSVVSTGSGSNNGTLAAVRSSIAKAQKANEEARKALAARAS
ncbi:kinase-like protein [Lentinus tigrinus ALCF2SS1-7]|uniref:non-specific serine/threonine protein kinase n=1 Tax=Lentinus tigrinus ALCF2SS1-6 TaxID=1328759 RepID=A0A5C2S939_9APHY|nr:kinase-like protein [Lentinus tigrinus ALCF2SS1-6]RPD78092.1 kinase-like protein [Lentinus tigrinus ALCF2SS1-7]